MNSKKNETLKGKFNKTIAGIKNFKFSSKLLLGAIASFLLLLGLFSFNGPMKDDKDSQTTNVFEQEDKKEENNGPRIKAAPVNGYRGYEGQPIPGKPFYYVNTSSVGNDTTGDGSSEKPYKTISKAINGLTDGGTVYLQTNATVSGTTLNKSIKLMADPTHNTSYKVTGGSTMFTINGDNELILENIKLDANGSTGSYSIIITGTVATNPTLTMLGDAGINNNKTVNGATAVDVTEGTINMFGGEMTKHVTDVGLLAIRSVNAKALNFLGGEIKNNSKTKYAGTGCISIAGDNYQSINVGGNMKIYDNKVQGSQKNLLLENSYNLNVVEDFSGEVYVNTTNRNSLGAVFGVIKNGATIYDGSFRNDSNTALYGGRNGTTLLWKNLAGIKSERLDDLDALLAQYNEEDYSVENWATLKRYITDAKAAIKATTTYAQLQSISISNVKKDCDAVLTLAQEAAIAAINAAVDALDEANYSPENWQLIIDAQASAIDNIINSDDIDLAKNDGLDEIASVLTIKGAALAELDAYLDNIENPSEDVIEIINNAKQEIEDCEDPSEIANLLEEATTEADDQVAEELRLAKEAAIAAINDLVDSLDENEFSPENWQLILDAQTDALDKIDLANVIEDVILEKNNGVEAIESIQSLRDKAKSDLDAYLETIDAPSEEVLAIIESAKEAIDECEDLDDLVDIVADTEGLVDIQVVKDEAKAELDAYLETIDNPSEEVLQMIEDAKAEIQDAEDLSDLPGIVSDALDEIAEEVLDELTKAKADAINEINALVDSLDEDDYSVADWQAILDAQSDALTNINNATTVLEVTLAKETGEEIIEGTLTLKGAALAELDAYLDSLEDEPSQEILDIINQAKGAINSCDDLSELEGIVSDAKANVDDQVADELAQEKLDAIEAINDFVDSLDEDDYSPENWQLILDAQEAAIKNINDATTIAEVALALENSVEAIESVLTLKETALKELDDYLADISDPSDEVIQIIEDAKDAIIAETDLSKLDDIVSKAKEDAALQIAKDAAKAELDAYLENLVDEPSQEILDFVNDAKNEIDACEIIDDIAPIVTSAKSDVDDQVVIDLQAAKDAAKAELDAYLENLVDEPSAATIAFINTAKNAIDSSSNIYSLDDIVSEAKDNVDDQVASELAEAQQAAKAIINALVDSLNPNDYTAENWQAILDAETEAIYNILRGATSISDVNAAKEAGIEAINGILTIKGTAKAELDAYLETIENPSEEVLQIIATAKENIDKEKNLSKLDGIVAQAIADANIQVAKDNAKAELDAYIAELDNPSNEVLTIIENAHAAIQACSDLDDFEGIIEKAIADIDLQIAKDNAKAELDAYIEELEEPSSEVLDIIAIAKANIDNATKISELAPIVSDAKDDIDLQLAREISKAELDDYLSTLDDPASAASIAIVAAAKEEIDNATKISELAPIVSDAKDDVDTQVADELQAAKDAAKAELDAYLASLDDPATAASIAIVTAAKEEIDKATKISELAPIVSDAKGDVDIQVADELAAAKAAAKAELDAYLASLDDPASQASQDLVDAAKEEIDKATTISGVTTLVTEAKLDVDAQVADELQAAKAAAKAELDAYLASLDDPASQASQDLVDAAKEEIDKATTISGVTTLVIEAKSDVDAQVAAELAQAKLDAIKAINDLVDSLDETDYTEANWATILVEQVDAIQNINKGTNLSEVANAKEAGLLAINSVPTIAEELQAAKDAAKAELDDYLANSPYVDGEIEDIIEAAKKEIDDATLISEVSPIVEQAKEDVNAEIAKHLDDAKEGAISNLEDYLANLDDPASDEVIAIIDAAKEAIADVSDVSELLNILNEAKADVDTQVALELDAAKDAAKAELDAYLASLDDPASPASQDLVDAAKEAIDNATKISEIAPIVSDAKGDVDTQVADELAAAKAAAKAELDAYLATLDDPATAASIAIVTAAKEEIDNATKISELAPVVSDAKGDVDTQVADELQAAKDAAIVAINVEVSSLVETNYSSENWQAIKDAQAEAIANINNGATIAGVNEAKDDGLDEIRSILTLEQVAAIELQDAKDAAKAELDAYLASLDDPATAASIAIVDAAKEEIDNATKISELAPIVSEAKGDVDTQVADELAAAKAAAKAELDAYLASLDDPASPASQDLVDAAKEAIDNAIKISEIAPIVSDAKTDVDTQVAAELAQAKLDAIKAINDLVDSLDESKYSPANWQAILDAQALAITNINNATTIVGVNTAKDAGLVAINDIETLLETGYDKPNVNDEPDKDTGGTATVTHPDLPGETIDIILPPLNGDDYNVSVDGDEVTYEYVDEETGVIVEVKVDLPEEGFVEEVTSAPDATTGGTAVVTHPDLPGLEVEVDLPALNGTDYEVSVDGDEVIYEYVDEETGAIVEVKVDLPEEGFVEEVTSAPDATTGGTAVVTHPDLPGLEVEVDLPALDDDSYEVENDYHEESMTGSVTYTYHDDETDTDISVVVDYDVSDLDMSWDVTDDATFTETGVLSGTSDDLPGVIIEIVLPELSEEYYDITDNGDGTSRYTLKDKNYGNIFFDVPNKQVKCLWPYIILELLIITGLIIWATFKRRKNKEKEAKTSMSVLPLVLIALVEYLPKGWQIIIPLLAVIIVLLAIYIAYLYFPRVKKFFDRIKVFIIKEKVSEETTHEKEETIEEALSKVTKEETSYKNLEEVIVTRTALEKEELVEHSPIVQDDVEESPIEEFEEIVKEEATEIVEEEVVTETVVKELVSEEVTSEKVIKVEVSHEVPLGPPSRFNIIYDYSFLSRLHLNDKETDARYNEIKNHLFSYEGVSSNMSWKQETFTYKGKMVAKLRLQGKTLRVFLSIDPKSLESKYRVEDKSEVKSLSSTPTLQMVKGPRQLAHALQLIDLSMKELEGQKLSDYKIQNYSLKKFSRDQLIEMGLIKVQNGKFTE